MNRILIDLKRFVACLCTLVSIQVTQSATPLTQWSGEGDAQDSIGSAHGTLVNGLGFTSGKIGQAFNFDGTNDYADFGPVPGNFGTNDFSIVFWISSQPTVVSSYIMGKRAVCNNANAWQFSLNPAGQIGVALNPGSTDQWASALSAASINDGNFHHISMIRQQTNLMIYVDGALSGVGMTPYIYSITNTAALTIGRIVCTGLGGHPHFRGQLDEIQLYNVALSGSEVLDLYNTPSALPVIEQHPDDLIISEGDTAAFSVVASGTNLEFQWFFEGATITSATKSILTLTNVGLGQAGQYYVAVSNEVGVVNSEIATLTVEEDEASGGPTVMWRGEGNALDSVGDNHGTLFNGAGFVGGRVGQAFSFDGINDYGDFGASAGNFQTNDFTIAYWIKAPPTAVNRYIMGKRAVCNNANAWQFSVNTSGHVGFAFNPDTTMHWSSVLSTVSVDDGVFHHIAVVRQQTNLLIYVDGLLNATTNSPFVFHMENTAPLTVGRIVCTGIDGSPHFAGQLDEIQLYDRSLLQSEIALLAMPPSQMPSIVAQPSSQIVAEGDTATFSVVADGGNLQYQWYFEDALIPQGTNDLLILSNVQLSQAGEYFVTISNDVGVVTSEIVTLTIEDIGSLSPVAWWKGEGDAVDSLEGHHGTLHNGTTFTNGRIGQAFSFDGADDYVSFSNVAGNFETNDFTVAFWIKAPSTTANSYIMGKRSICNNDSAWQFSFDTLGHVGVAMNHDQSGYNWIMVTSSSRVDDGEFHYVTAVRKGTALSLYVDGVLQGTSVSSWLYSIHNEAALTVGKIVCTGMDGHPYFRGQLDEIRLYGHDLTEAEIIANFNEGQEGPPLIVQQPKDATVVEGANASFAVAVSGNAPMYFQWYRDGSPVFGATNNTYQISNVTLGDAGSFHVGISNSVGFVISDSVQLTVLETGPLPNGLVGWWPGDGNANDVIGTNHGMLHDGTTFTAGKFGQSFYFDGVNDHVSFGRTAGNFGTNDFTVAFWIQAKPTPVNSYIMGKRSICNNDSAWQFSLSSAGYVGVAINADTTFKWVGGFSTSRVDDEQFHHVAAVRSGKTLSLYIDGLLELVQITPFVYNVQNEGNFTAGRTVCTGIDGHPHFAGQLDELQLYHQALTSSEIRQLQEGTGVHVNARPPVIVLQPRNQRRNQGNSPTFKVTAVGTQPMTYQWLTNGLSIPNATNAILTVENLNETAGFSVLVSNPYGFVLSDTAFIVNDLAVGNFNGLFYESDSIRHETSGSLRLRLTRTGAFSARILSGGGVYPLTGRFQDGNFAGSVPRSGGSPLDVQLHLTTENEVDCVLGTISSDDWVAPVVADHRWHSTRNPAPQAGRYTLAISSETSEDGPIGFSFGSVRVSSGGLVRFLGSLADNSRAIQSVGLSARGEWPLYLPLYRGAGSVIGWLTFTNATNSSLVGNVNWIKTEAFGPHFSNGFTNSGYLEGSTYLPPTNRTLINVTNAIVLLTGDVEISNDVVLRSNDAVLQGKTNYQILRMNPTSGLFSGSAIDPLVGTRVPIRGAVVQESTNAFGYFLTTNYNGAVNVKPQ